MYYGHCFSVKLALDIKKHSAMSFHHMCLLGLCSSSDFKAKGISESMDVKVILVCNALK